MAEQAIQHSISVGDHVRLKNFAQNQHQSYLVTTSHVSITREAVDGLVLSIREIATGQLVGETSGDFDAFVIEILYDNTFNPKVASVQNAPRTAERPNTTRNWQRMRAVLREFKDKGEFISTTTPGFLTESPLAKTLDGWKIIKVWSNEIASLEKPETQTESAG